MRTAQYVAHTFESGKHNRLVTVDQATTRRFIIEKHQFRAQLFDQRAKRESYVGFLAPLAIVHLIQQVLEAGPVQ